MENTAICPLFVGRLLPNEAGREAYPSGPIAAALMAESGRAARTGATCQWLTRAG